MAYHDLIEQTFYEHWPDDLRSLSIPTRELKLSMADVIALGSVDLEFRTRFNLLNMVDFTSSVYTWIDEAATHFYEGAYLRTNYGGFRECPFVFSPIKTRADFLSVIRWPDKRILKFLEHRLHQNAGVVLLAREWRSIEAWSELRVFLRDKKVIGISPYHHKGIYQALYTDHTSVINALNQFLPGLQDSLHMDTVIADVFIQGTPTKYTVHLLELTPFYPGADACLFDWNRSDDFDGSFRYRNPQSEIERRELV